MFGGGKAGWLEPTGLSATSPYARLCLGGFGEPVGKGFDLCFDVVMD